MMGYGYGNDGWWNSGMWFMGIFWVALIGLAVWAVVRLGKNGDQQMGTTIETPRQVLDRRFAAGDIDETQYAQARRVLEGRSLDEARS